MSKEHSIASLFATYCFVPIALLSGLWFCATTLVASPSEQVYSKPARTLLDERIATMREIRAALARPIPPPEPLAPITARPANPGPKAFVRSSFDKPEKRKLSREARNALAMEAAGEPKLVARSLLVPERGGANGW